MGTDIKRIVEYYVRLCNTRNPFRIADQLRILYQIGKCKNEGCYMYLKRHRYIFLSDALEGPELNLVMAHELGHALLDCKANCYFMRNHTLFLTSKFEKRANAFAAFLLITDEDITEYAGATEDQLAKAVGCPKQLVNIRLQEGATF